MAGNRFIMKDKDVFRFPGRYTSRDGGRESYRVGKWKSKVEFTFKDTLCELEEGQINKR